MVPFQRFSNEYRLSSSFGVLGAICLTFFLGMLFASTGIVLYGSSPELWRKIVLGLLMFGTWSAMSLLALWLILAAWRERLWIGKQGIAQRGLTFNQTARWEEIESLHWRHLPRGGSAILRATQRKFVIYFNNYAIAARQEIIQGLRDCVPEHVQIDWPAFCYGVALPLRTGQRILPAEAESAMMYRWHWDALLLPLVVLASIASGYLAWAAQQPQVAIVPLLPLVLWLWLRFSIPRGGRPTLRRKVRPVEKRYFVLLASWFCGCIGATMLIERLATAAWRDSLMLGCLAILSLGFFSLLAVFGFHAHLVEREEMRAAGPKAEQKWRQMDQQSLGCDPAANGG